MRDPVDRFYSQYRFEHLEHRDGTAADAPTKPFYEWYRSKVGANMGENYYVKTFLPNAQKTVDVPGWRRGDFYWTYHRYRAEKLTWQQFEHAVDTLRRFDVLLVTEWLDHAEPHLNRTLGWEAPPRHVLPHEDQAPRTGASKNAKEALPPDQYQEILQENWADVLLFEWARRVHAERLACEAEAAVEGGGAAAAGPTSASDVRRRRRLRSTAGNRGLGQN